MTVQVAKLAKVLRNHFDGIPLLMETASKYHEAKNAVQVVDAVVPAEYKIAAIVDDYNAPTTQDVGDDNPESAVANFCTAYNTGREREIKGLALLTPERLQGIISLITLLAPLFTKR